MKITNIIHVFAGLMIVLSISMGYYYHTNWLYLTLFVGLNLFQYGFTNFCPLEFILKKLGFKS